VSSTGDGQQPGGPSEPADPDDWDHHWDVYGEAAQGNPANLYRRRLVLRLLGRPPAGSTVLDIGSGQGELALHLATIYPDVDVWGVEYSAAGVQRSRAAAAEHGLGVRFTLCNLLEPVTADPNRAPATHAVCSEVLEHVDDPVRLMRNARALMAPGARIVVTVPGGPRSAFDRHIGHYQHFKAADISAVLTGAGFTVERVLRAGFPFFNLYKLAVVARGRRLISDVQNRAPGAVASRAEAAATRVFDVGFRHNRDDSALGWQMVALAHVPSWPESP
jgi:2-polyprenyl-3-methyl-5-hydroxy-6-metoxy-1,4-benzoquinol methylase